MAGEHSTSLDEAKQLVAKGQLAAARDTFQRVAEEASAQDNYETERDAILGMAESQWQLGEQGAALVSYEAALSATRKAGDQAGEGMVLLGKGFALMSLGRGKPAREAFQRSAEMAEAQGHAAQQRFALDLLQQAQGLPDGEGDLGEAGTVGRGGEGEAAGDAAGEAAVARAFVRSFTAKAPAVLVMKGSPSEPACGFSRDAVEALYGVRLQYAHLDIALQPHLEAAFKAEHAWPTFPMLFVGGRLLGGRDIVCELAEQGLLRGEIEGALGDSFSPEQIQALFSGEGVEPGEGGGGKGACQSKHEARLRRVVVWAYATVVGNPSLYDPASADAPATAAQRVPDILAAHSDSPPALLAPAFIRELSQALGGFAFPATLLEEAPTVAELVAYIEANCPAQGDCSACPTRSTCSVHNQAEEEEGGKEGALPDLEDMEGAAVCGIASLHPPAVKRRSRAPRSPAAPAGAEQSS